MRRGLGLDGLRHLPRLVVAMVTIAAIVGTLCGCGRYGPPKRPTAMETFTLVPSAPANPN